jgi:RAB protein geranylgeranyltransferase component A
MKKTQREKVESHRSRDEIMTKPKLSINTKKKRRFLSSASKYADDEGIDAECT